MNKLAAYSKKSRLVGLVTENRRILASILDLKPVEVNKLLGFDYKASNCQTKHLTGINGRLVQAIRWAGKTFQADKLKGKDYAYKSFKKFFVKCK